MDRRKLFLGLQEWIGDLLAAISGRDEHDQGATSHDQAQRAGGLVALVI